jgi:hypothetical protein
MRLPAQIRSGGSHLLVAALLASGLCGCTQKRQFQPKVDPDTLTDTQFLHYLETVPVVTFAEGCRAALIAGDGEDRFKTHEARYSELRSRGMVRDAWGLEPDDVLDLGTMCFMAAEACDLSPSASSTLLGSWGLGDRRYAVRKAVAADLVAYGPYYKPMTGGATVWAMGRMDDYLTSQGVYAEPTGVLSED